MLTNRPSHPPLRALLSNQVALGQARRAIYVLTLMDELARGRVILDRRVATDYGFSFALLKVRVATRGATCRVNPRSQYPRFGGPLAASTHPG